jgi:hypothetical protein
LVLIENPCKGKFAPQQSWVVNIKFCYPNFTFFNESLTPHTQHFLCCFEQKLEIIEGVLKKSDKKSQKCKSS